MKTIPFCSRCTALLFTAIALSYSSNGQPLQLLSNIDSNQSPPAGGSGDSWAPIISGDGRFVLFASAANNLLLMTNGAPMPVRIPPALNVFLRDRTNSTTALVSVNLSGVAGGNGDSLPQGVSTDGRFVLFQSSASDLVAGDTNNVGDIFLRDLLAGTTTLVSTSTNGGFGNGASRDAVLTPDGHYTAFVSAANNLVPRDTNRIADVFVRDLQAGTTTLASVGAVSTSASPPLGSSEAPEITPDGRYVAFYSTATNLVAGAPRGGDVYVRDLVLGTTTWASAGARALTFASLRSSNVVCFNHAISSDGQYVAYEASLAANTGPNYSGLILRYTLASGVTDLVHTNAVVAAGSYEDLRTLDLTPDGRFIAFLANTNGTVATNSCVFVWDAQAGTVTLASGGLDGTVQPGSTCDWPMLSADGHFVAFASTAANLVTNPLVPGSHLFVRELVLGATTLVDVDASGNGSTVGPSSVPSFSADGRFLAFDYPDGNLVPNDRNRDTDVFVRGLFAGATELISVRDASLPSVTPNGLSVIAPSSISSDGRFVAFASEANNLTANDTNGCRDIFVRDVLAGTNVLVSIATNGFSADGVSAEPSISADGRYVAFSSQADNLVPADTNNVQDVFVRDLQSGTTTQVSVRNDGAQGNGPSYSPTISSSGRFVLFRSRASNLVPGTIFSTENLFYRDLRTGNIFALSTNAFMMATMTPDGRFVAFVDGNSLANGKLYLWDSQSAARVYTNATRSPVFALSLSPDGSRIAYWTNSSSPSLTVFDRITNTGWAVATSSGSIPRPALKFSADRQTMVYNEVDSGTGQIYLYDFSTGASLLVSQGSDGMSAGNGDSDSPDLSADGRFVVYRSSASNLVSGDANGLPGILLFDRVSGSNSLLSASLVSTGGGNNRSFAPFFSPDGHTICFGSWASDLAAADFSHASDLFAFNFLYAVILPGSDTTRGPWLSWPSTAGKNYRVQYKDNLWEADWHDLSATATNQGNKAWLQDPSPAPAQRFYRIRAF